MKTLQKALKGSVTRTEKTGQMLFRMNSFKSIFSWKGGLRIGGKLIRIVNEIVPARRPDAQSLKRQTRPDTPFVSTDS